MGRTYKPVLEGFIVNSIGWSSNQLLDYMRNSELKPNPLPYGFE